jgi:hypothetical protein
MAAAATTVTTSAAPMPTGNIAITTLDLTIDRVVATKFITHELGLTRVLHSCVQRARESEHKRALDSYIQHGEKAAIPAIATAAATPSSSLPSQMETLVSAARHFAPMASAAQFQERFNAVCASSGASEKTDDARAVWNELENYVTKPRVAPISKILVATLDGEPIGVVGVFAAPPGADGRRPESEQKAGGTARQCCDMYEGRPFLMMQSIVATPAFLLAKMLHPEAALPGINASLIPAVRSFALQNGLHAIIADPFHHQMNLLIAGHKFVRGRELAYNCGRLMILDMVVCALSATTDKPAAIAVEVEPEALIVFDRPFDEAAARAAQPRLHRAVMVKYTAGAGVSSLGLLLCGLYNSDVRELSIDAPPGLWDVEYNVRSFCRVFQSAGKLAIIRLSGHIDNDALRTIRDQFRWLDETRTVVLLEGLTIARASGPYKLARPTVIVGNATRCKIDDCMPLPCFTDPELYPLLTGEAFYKVSQARRNIESAYEKGLAVGIAAARANNGANNDASKPGADADADAEDRKQAAVVPTKADGDRYISIANDAEAVELFGQLYAVDHARDGVETDAYYLDPILPPEDPKPVPDQLAEIQALCGNGAANGELSTTMK